MNPDTRVIICCYEGDAHQINYDAMLRHECPITVLSPTDSPAIPPERPGIDWKTGGKRAYIGQDSLDRQHEHFKLMLTYPEKFFLMHDSDSILLDPKIPDYLYEKPDLLWSNQVDDAIPEHQSTFPPGWPHVAFQPPYFCSRETIEKLVAVGDDPRVKATEVMPFIDYYMVQLAMVANVSWARLADCCSCPIAPDPAKADTLAQVHKNTYSNGYKIGMQRVLIEGAIFMHSIKDPNAINDFIAARANFLAGNPNPVPRYSPAPVVGRGRQNVNNRGIGLRGQRQGRATPFADPRGLKA